MTYLPGQDEAIYPGTNHITADACIEDDRHTVVLDASAIATPTLDGFMATLSRALDDAGILDEFCVLGRNRGNIDRCMQALDAIHSERTVARTLMFTMTPADAERVATNLDDAAREPDWCSHCRSRYAQHRDLCPPCSQVEDDRTARAAS